jgi:hypothetical protein
MSKSDALLVVTFRADKVKNEAKSVEAGRPIYDDIELCEVRTAGDRETVKVFPAHAFHQWAMNEEGEQEQITYAQRWSEQYRRFKERRAQIQEGTPLSELPFLTEAQRSTLKALNVHTAETLASIDGPRLKTLGMGGREWKNQAQAYIDNASGSANVTAMAAKIEMLQQQIAALSAAPQPVAPAESPATADDFDGYSDDDLKDYIATQVGARPRGNPNRDTLLRMAREAAPAEAA